MPRMKFDSRKPKNIKKAFKNLFAYLRPYKVPTLISIVLIVFATIFRLIGPNKLGELANLIESSIKGEQLSMTNVWKIGALLIVLYSLGAVFTYVNNLLITRVCFKMSQKLRNEISRKINKIPIKYIDKTPYGKVLSTVTNDVDTIGQTLQTGITELLGAAVLFLGSLTMMFVINWFMAICAVISSLIGFSVMFVIIKKSQKHFLAHQNRLADLNGVIEENYAGQTAIKTCNAKEEMEEKFNAVNEKLYSSSWKSQIFSGVMHPLMAFVGNLGYVVVCIVGSALAVSGKIEVGVIVSFIIYIRYFTNPLSQIAQAMTSVQMAAAASERVFDFLAEEELSNETEKTAKIENLKGNVEIEHVKFGYDESKEVIHDFSAKIKAGQKVAIVGATGAGKTTIVNLLMRFYDVQSGDIKIDGISIYDMTRSQIRDIFAMVLQDTWLFEGTIRENLVYNKTDVTDEMLDKVCEICGISHIIKSLPHGYDTMLSGETNISVGQKQLFTIARAMLQNAPMLILDEATSNVDTRTEILIQKAMDKLTEGRTSFVIAHRLSTIKNADLILFLKDGDVVESGTHNSLIKKGGYYCELYNSQFSFEGLDDNLTE